MHRTPRSSSPLGRRGDIGRSGDGAVATRQCWLAFCSVHILPTCQAQAVGKADAVPSALRSQAPPSAALLRCGRLQPSGLQRRAQVSSRCSTAPGKQQTCTCYCDRGLLTWKIEKSVRPTSSSGSPPSAPSWAPPASGGRRARRPRQLSARSTRQPRCWCLPLPEMVSESPLSSPGRRARAPRRLARSSSSRLMPNESRLLVWWECEREAAVGSPAPPAAFKWQCQSQRQHRPCSPKLTSFAQARGCGYMCHIIKLRREGVACTVAGKQGGGAGADGAPSGPEQG